MPTRPLTGKVWCVSRPTLSRHDVPLPFSQVRPSVSETLPTVLDIEASGFGRSSYPIEVGIARADGTSCAFLIQPLEEWTHWDPKAELLHGIARERLMREGYPVRQVARWLNDELSGEGKAYSDSWGTTTPGFRCCFITRGCCRVFVWKR